MGVDVGARFVMHRAWPRRDGFSMITPCSAGHFSIGESGQKQSLKGNELTGRAMDVGQMRKGTTRLILLKVLADAGKPLHGYALVNRLRARGRVLEFPESMVYPALHRMEREGLIVGRWVEQSGGPRRKVYVVTEIGRRELAAGLEAWLAVRRDVDSLLGLDER